MFHFIIRGNRPVFNILKRHVVKRHVNNNSAFILSRSKNKVIDCNLVKDLLVKNVKINSVSVTARKYSGLPEPIEEKIQPQTFYIAHEDSFAHSILESREIYAKNIVQNLPSYNDNEITKEEVDNYVTQSWKSLEVPEIIEAFKKISYYASKNGENITSSKYTKFLKYLITNCEQFTDNEMSDVLKSTVLWPLLHTRHDVAFKSFYTALDKECVRRAYKWDFDTLLLFADHWYRIRLLRYSEFALYLTKKMGSKTGRMTPSNLVQLMFYVSASRKHPGDMYNLEYKMESCIDELDLDEVAILAMGFFKSQTPIRNPNLLVKIIQRLIQNMDTVHEISLSAFMKIIRYSTIVQRDGGILWELLLSTIPQIPRLSLQALVHVILTAARSRIFQPELLTAVAERFNKEMNNARTKDMERLLLVFSSFDFNPDTQPNTFETVVEELRTPKRITDLERYPRTFANLLQYLSVVNIYPKDLIAMVLDPENLKRTYGPSSYGIQESIFILDRNVDVDVPDYTGPRLSSETLGTMAKRHVNKVPQSYHINSSARHNLMSDVMDTCKEIFGSTEVTHLDWVLPQYKEADLIICLDKNNSPLKINDILSKIPLGSIKRRPETIVEGSRWFALIVGPVNSYIRDSCHLLGKDAIKIRQLEKIGYQPIMIPWYEWYSTGLDRNDYLRQKLFN